MKPLKNIISCCLVILPLLSFSQKPEWQYFTMNGNECKIFTTAGNSRIIVPAYSFTTNNSGEAYVGPVQIAFKEYKDQADFILGGLSLRYEINGALKTLQSGGMFEIKITTGNKSLQELGFAGNKKVVVKFAIDPKFDVAGLEPFYFDPVTKQWVKNTRFGKSKESNQPISDKSSELWQDDPRITDFRDQPGDYNDDMDPQGGCYTILDPVTNRDTLICPNNNPLDGRYQAYLSDQAYKSMQIDKMGLYNFDKIFNDENNVPMFVHLKTKDGKDFDLTDKLYVVYKTSNSVIYYYKSDLEKSFSLIPRNDIKIFSYNADGTISKVPDSFWKNFDARLMRGKTMDLPFETIKLATLTKDEFASVTGLKN